MRVPKHWSSAMTAWPEGWIASCREHRAPPIDTIHAILRREAYRSGERPLCASWTTTAMGSPGVSTGCLPDGRPGRASRRRARRVGAPNAREGGRAVGARETPGMDEIQASTGMRAAAPAPGVRRKPRRRSRWRLR